jgi:hypothetical protein
MLPDQFRQQLRHELTLRMEQTAAQLADNYSLPFDMMRFHQGCYAEAKALLEFIDETYRKME